MDVAAVAWPEVSAEWDALFDAGPGFQSSRAWFDATIEAAMPPASHAVALLCRDAGRPSALLPLRLGPGVHGLSTVYTCLFQPLLAPGIDPAATRRCGAALARYARRWPVLVLDALDPAWPGLAPLLAGFRDGGMAARCFEHFGNWHEAVAGRSWTDYLAARPGTLRETIRRKSRACDRDGRVRIEVVRGHDGLGPAIAAYEDVYARSWKDPELAPGFTAALLRRAAAAGVLRLGVLRVGDVPVASQYWIVDGPVTERTATVLKLAHDDAWAALSPGTVLTAHMIRGVLDEGAAWLDFGRGDDGYKAAWAARRRPRVGVLLAAPWRAGGLTTLLRHDAGTIWRRIRRDRSGSGRFITEV